MIRPTTPEDADSLIALADETGMFKPLEIEALGEVLHDYFAENQQLGHRAVTAEAAGVITGFAYYAPAAMTEGTWHLWWIAVKKGLQGKGQGGDLLRHVEEGVRASGGRHLLIETGSLPHYEPTRQFYLKHDYDRHAVIEDFYAAGDSMVIFRKKFA